MAGARLLVEKGAARDQSQDWGQYDFLALPSPGDRVVVQRDGAAHYLTVLCVHHRPAVIDQMEGSGEHEFPTADVVAKWTGSE